MNLVSQAENAEFGEICKLEKIQSDRLSWSYTVQTTAGLSHAIENQKSDFVMQ